MNVQLDQDNQQIYGVLGSKGGCLLQPNGSYYVLGKDEHGEDQVSQHQSEFLVLSNDQTVVLEFKLQKTSKRDRWNRRKWDLSLSATRLQKKGTRAQKKIKLLEGSVSGPTAMLPVFSSVMSGDTPAPGIDNLTIKKFTKYMEIDDTNVAKQVYKLHIPKTSTDDTNTQGTRASVIDEDEL